MIHLTIHGELASKSNSRRIVKRGTRPVSIKSEKAVAFCNLFHAQIEPMPELIEVPVSLDVVVYYASRRPDLDVELLKDLLQGYVYVNDRQVWSMNCDKWFDKADPRVEVTVRPLSEESVWEREAGLAHTATGAGAKASPRGPRQNGGKEE